MTLIIMSNVLVVAPVLGDTCVLKAIFVLKSKNSVSAVFGFVVRILKV